MKKRILIIAYVLLLFVTVSFAWLSNAQERINETLDIDFISEGKNAIITDFDFGAYLERRLEDGEAVEDVDDDGYVPAEEDETLFFNEKTTVPGTRIPFRIRILNKGNAVKKTKLVLDIYIAGCDPNSDDEAERKKAEVLDVIYVEIVLGDGFNKNLDGASGESVETRHVFKKLSEATYNGNGVFSIELYGNGEELSIPTAAVVNENLRALGKEQNGHVALNCSFYYDQLAGAKYQGMSIDALSFRLEQ